MAEYRIEQQTESQLERTRLTKEERQSLYMLARELNHTVRCPAAQNQVYVLSRMKSNGRLRKETPQVAIDCKVRSFLGWKKKVYEEFIRKVCCGDYKDQCEAWRTFMARRRNSFMAPEE